MGFVEKVILQGTHIQTLQSRFDNCETSTTTSLLSYMFEQVKYQQMVCCKKKSSEFAIKDANKSNPSGHFYSIHNFKSNSKAHNF